MVWPTLGSRTAKEQEQEQVVKRKSSEMLGAELIVLLSVNRHEWRAVCTVQISKLVGFKVEPQPESSLAEMSELGLTKHLAKSASPTHPFRLNSASAESHIDTLT